MKRTNLYSVIAAGIAICFASSCRNNDIEFPDFDYSAVYFAYQTPVRTLVMGEDTYDTSMDNAHKCQIYATMGGVYSNDKKIEIDVLVDNDLCTNLYFEDGVSPVKAMPESYYTLSADKIILDKNIMGAVDVQFTDAFFNDPDALKNTYVIPLRMTNVTNADSILLGTPKVADAPWTDNSMWDVAPKNYVLYCVKYINEWHANYLRRGVDVITEDGKTTTNVRHSEYVEDDEICSITTKDLNTAIFPVSTAISSSESLKCDLVLSFDENKDCKITSGTVGYTASGTGKFVKDGDKNSWGNKDRDVLYLEYEVDFGVRKYQTKDTLVVRDRGVKLETFTPVYKNN